MAPRKTSHIGHTYILVLTLHYHIPHSPEGVLPYRRHILVTTLVCDLYAVCICSDRVLSTQQGRVDMSESCMTARRESVPILPQVGWRTHEGNRDHTFASRHHTKTLEILRFTTAQTPNAHLCPVNADDAPPHRLDEHPHCPSGHPSGAVSRRRTH